MAMILGARMAYAASAAGSGRWGGGCGHDEASADPDNCPFCTDRAAYQAFQSKLRSEQAK
ncbi:hypothetical protein ACIA5D_17835 [Actinoplanes sp. NPDC051513]|uniref:hypothetical protein n=1 Tax=Actinoplanes sp. NPDC051513 TaxID=3363908 RepID=UPI0037BE02CB